MRPIGLPVLLFLSAALPSATLAQQLSQALRDIAPLLETYESNTIGWTNDSDDVGFLDVNLSLKYPIMPNAMYNAKLNSRVYFAASTRFAQYLGTRKSSPVVGKRFNPKLIWRQVTSWDEKGFQAGKTCNKTESTDGCDYVDIAFAHESNGQSVDNERLFMAEKEFGRFSGRPEFARDYISRGWDYLELAVRRWGVVSSDIRVDTSFKYFLRHGPLQGDAEEFFDFEDDPEVKVRRRVHGLALLGTWERPGTRLALRFETGGSRPLRYNTVRVEYNQDFAELPLMIFYQNGYSADLALFYKRTSSVGVALALSTF